MFPLKTISPSAVEPVFRLAENFTGSTICAWAMVMVNSKIAKDKAFFISYLVFVMVLYIIIRLPPAFG